MGVYHSMEPETNFFYDNLQLLGYLLLRGRLKGAETGSYLVYKIDTQNQGLSFKEMQHIIDTKIPDAKFEDSSKGYEKALFYIETGGKIETPKIPCR